MALSGIDIMKDKNTFKSTYQIMDELSRKWKDLTDIQQASITELIAGKRQGNVVSSLMQNFDIARNALETSLNSSGSATKELNKWQESLEARLLKLKAAWQSLSQSFMKSDFLKGAMDAVIGLVNAIDKVISKVGILPTFITAFAAFKSFSGFGLFKVIEDEASASGKRIASIFSTSLSSVRQEFNNLGIKTNLDFKGKLNFDTKSLFAYRAAVKNGMSETEAFKSTMENASEAAQAYAKSGQVASKGILEFGKQQKSAQVTLVAQNKSMSSAKAIMKEYNGGCQNVVMSQKDFVNAVNTGNPALGKYLSGLNGAKATTVGYIKSLIGAKVATIGLQAATMLLNAALTMGISAAISLLISKFDEWYVSASELSEKVDEVTSKYKEQHDALMDIKGDYDTKNEESMINKYARLSKGVGSFNENLSLTADEYSEYQSIVNQIAEQIPSLVSGYDSQGNAILSCTGNVKELTKAYEDLISAQNNEVLSNIGNIKKDFENAVKDTEDSFWHPFRAGSRHVKALEDIYNGKDVDEIFSNLRTEDKDKHNSNWSIASLLEDAGYDVSWKAYTAFGDDELKKKLKEIQEKNPKIIKSIVDNYNNTLDEETAGMKSIAEAILSNAFDISDSDYYSMSDTMKNIAIQTVNSFDFEFLKGLRDEGIGIDTYVNDMLDQLNSISKKDNTSIESAFELKTRFNGGKISYGEYVNGLKNASNLIDGLDLKQEVKDQIKLSLNTDEVLENYDALKERLTSDEYNINMKTDEAEKFLDGLTASEYSVAVDLIVNGKGEVDLSNFDIKSLRDYIEKKAKLQESMNFTIGMDVETTSVESLNTAMQESVSAAGLSSDSISALKGRYAELESQGYDLSQMFEETSNGIHLNKRAVSELEQAYASQKLAETDGHLKTLKGRYDELTKEINNCNDASDRASLYVEQQSILQKINDLGTLASQYEGLASAYKAWQDVESAGNERDMYEGIIEGFENIDDEISRGWMDDGTVKFLELLTGKNLSTASIDKINAAYKSLDKTIGKSKYSIRDFFTVNDDGDSTNTGVYNFLETVETFEDKLGDVVKRDGKGNIIGFDFEVAGGDEAIAEALGISEELVQIMVRAADDAGFVVTIDGSYTQFADLQNQAEKANNSLKKLSQTNEELKKAGFDDYDFNFNVNTIEDANTELEKAKELLNNPAFKDKNGNFNINAKGAKDALKIAETLQIAKNKLEEPSYMSVDTSKLQEDLQKPVEQLQEFEKLTQERDLLNLTGTDKERLSEIDDELDKIATNLSNLDEETKIKLGIQGKTPEQIREELENGTIEVPTELTIEANMDKNLEDLVTLGLLEQGLITEKEAKIRLGIEVEGDDASEKIEEFIDSAEIEEDKKVTIKAVAEVFGVDDVDELKNRVDSLTDEQIQILAKVLGNLDVEKLKTSIGKLDDKTIEAIAHVLGAGDVEGLKTIIQNMPDKKIATAIAQAFGYNDVDSLCNAIGRLDDKDVQAIATALGISDVNSLKSAIDRLDGKNVDAVAEVTGKSNVDNLRSAISALKNKTVKVKSVFTTIKETLFRTGSTRNDSNGFGTVDGTAHVSGTAFAEGTINQSKSKQIKKSGKAYRQGDWGVKKTVVALTGELGQELVVYKNRWYTVGDNGAEFATIPKGAIVFNHKICGIA